MNLELEYKQNLYKLEELKNMSYVTSFEHIVLKKGLQQVCQEGILLIARNLLKHNALLSLIKSVTGLSEQALNLEKK